MTIIGIHDVGAVADRPEVRRAAHAHIRISQQSAALLGHIESVHQKRCRGADRTHDRGAAKHSTIMQLDTLGRRRYSTSVENHVDTCLFHLRAGKFS
jgi:hypothetical protein